MYPFLENSTNGIAIFQGILIILILVLCTNQRAKYKRRLKAATIGNSVISDTLLRNRAQPVMQVNDKPGGPHGSGKVVPSNNVPNTNKHATQGMYEKMGNCDTLPEKKSRVSTHFNFSHVGA